MRRTSSNLIKSARDKWRKKEKKPKSASEQRRRRRGQRSAPTNIKLLEESASETGGKQ